MTGRWTLNQGRKVHILLLLYKHKALFLFMQKLIIQCTFLCSSQRRNSKFYGGSKYIKGPAFYRHGEEVSFPAMTT